jgi:argininosuccinate synthase
VPSSLSTSSTLPFRPTASTKCASLHPCYRPFPDVNRNAVFLFSSLFSLAQGVYLLGTSLARPVIARAMMDVVVEEECGFVSHGCTGKGNDQVRFELAFYALQPDVKVLAPWRDPVFYERFAGRQALLDYAASKGVPVFQTAAKPWSTGSSSILSLLVRNVLSHFAL